MDYTLQQLRYLVAVAEHGNISAAARSLYTSQPGVSAAVAHLERVFGIQCFVRHHAKGISLTPAGRSFVATARNLLLHAEDLLRHANELNQSAQGVLTIGCFYTISPFFLPRILQKLRKKYPGIDVQIREGDTDQLQQSLLNGLIEVALLYDLGLDRSLSKLEVTSFNPYVLLPKHDKLAKRSSVRLADLVDKPLILFDRPQSREYLLSLFAVAGKQPTIAQRTSNFELVRGLVAAGFGYSILNLRPKIDRSYDGSSVACVPVVGNARGLPVVLASVAASKLTRRAMAFIDVCTSTLKR
jgi:DNA-binding transcriptional LysR family regulator